MHLKILLRKELSNYIIVHNKNLNVVPENKMTQVECICIFNRYIMFGRGICEKYQSRDEQFPEPSHFIFRVPTLFQI